MKTRSAIVSRKSKMCAKMSIMIYYISTISNSAYRWNKKKLKHYLSYAVSISLFYTSYYYIFLTFSKRLVSTFFLEN